MQLVPETSGSHGNSDTKQAFSCWCLGQNGSKCQVVSHTRKDRKLEPGAMLGRGLFPSNDFINVSDTTCYQAARLCF